MAVIQVNFEYFPAKYEGPSNLKDGDLITVTGYNGSLFYLEVGPTRGGITSTYFLGQGAESNKGEVKCRLTPDDAIEEE